MLRSKGLDQALGYDLIMQSYGGVLAPSRPSLPEGTPWGPSQYPGTGVDEHHLGAQDRLLRGPASTWAQMIGEDNESWPRTMVTALTTGLQVWCVARRGSTSTSRDYVTTLLVLSATGVLAPKI